MTWVVTKLLLEKEEVHCLRTTRFSSTRLRVTGEQKRGSQRQSPFSSPNSYCSIKRIKSQMVTDVFELFQYL